MHNLYTKFKKNLEIRKQLSEILVNVHSGQSQVMREQRKKKKWL